MDYADLNPSYGLDDDGLTPCCGDEAVGPGADMRLRCASCGDPVGDLG